MADKKKWYKLGTIKESEKGTRYLALGSPKSTYEPVNVTVIVTDLSGKELARAVNPSLNIQNPRKRPGITEEQAAKIPAYVMAEVSLPPAKDAS